MSFILMVLTANVATTDNQYGNSEYWMQGLQMKP